MKRKVSKLRLSPNEEARIIREEHERRRKLRIQQVREQQRYIALQIRREVEQRRQHELDQLEQELREDWTRQQNDKLQTLQRLYQESLQLVGQSHRSAKENEPDLAAVAQREEENRTKAEERYREALKELKTQKIRDHERQNQIVNARKKALQAEKERSAKVASLPPPLNPIQNIDVKKPHVVRRCDPSAFASTHYHMLESVVEREADTAQPDAHTEAELEARRLQELQEEEKRKREEQLERARVRGRQALRREQLVQDRERLLVELEHLQQTDLLRRRQQVSQMPPQIFQPLHKRQETREDFQRELEFAFEDLYTRERRLKGDLVVQLEPEPLPGSSDGSQDQELDVSVAETPPEAELQTESEREAGSTEHETSADAAEPPRPPPRRALRKLLDRIRNQRSEWVSSSSRVSDSPTVFTDQIPERDTSIESGSLQSDEKLKETPIEVPEPTIPPPGALELRNQAEISLPDVLVSKIQEFEKERKKKEEELETEKRQQVFLLQELEEQKAKLEQMLLEAQQERDQLKAAVTRETALNGPQEPEENQEATFGSATKPAPPAGEDHHAGRIREYQQRLLEQNRVHQRSVEVARQRLEEYQRALQIRHNMPTRSPLSVSGPPTVCTQPDAPLQRLTAPAGPPFVHTEPQTSEEVPVRDSEASCPASRSSVSSRTPSDESARLQRPDVNAQLTDDIMKRVTEHLPERLRPPSVSEEQPPHKPPSRHKSISSQPTSDRLRAVGRSEGPDPASGEEDTQRQRRRRQEVQRRAKEQREAGLQQEERQRNDVELEQMRRQKEALQALIDTDEQHGSHTSCEELQAEDVHQQRMRLLASLLKAIEESHGGSLSHLEEPEENGDALQQTLSASAGTAQSSGPAGPPLSSILLSGLFHPPRAPKPPVTRVKLGFKEMTEQHELSAIQEVETPVNMSHIAGQEGFMSESSHATDQDLQDESESFVSSDGTLQTLSASSSGQQTSDRRVHSETSGHLPWRERQLSGAGSPPEQSDSDSILKKNSSLSSDSGRGADFSGPGNTSYKSPTEPRCGPPESDCFSTISSGSYVTTDPNNSNTDKSLSFRESGADLSHVSSPSGVEENSAVARPAAAVLSVFNDSSIQRIIDKYTRELNVSLSSAGMTGRTMEDENSGGRFDLSPTAGAQRSVTDVEQDLSLSDQDAFRPLIGHLTDQSSCLAADQRESVLEQLVGQPSAHSSMITSLSGPPVSLSFDQTGWDSTVSRMIGRLSHQSSSHWLSPGQDDDAGELGRRAALEASWLDGGPEESRMRPLVGELDESEQHSGSFGESNQAVPADVSSDQTTSVPRVAPPIQDQTGSVDLDSHVVEEGSDLFHPLEAEITHNETANPPATFHLPEHEVPEGSFGFSTPSVGFEPSPEQLRAEERTSPSLQESFSQLVLSESHLQDSVLTEAVSEHSAGENQEFLLVSDKIKEAAEEGILEQSQITLVSLTDTTLQDEETTIVEETVQEDPLSGGVKEDEQTEELVSTSLPKETPEDHRQARSGTVLEFQWGPGKDLQKHTALLQSSSRRVEEMKTKAARAKTQPQNQDPVRAGSVTRTAKITSEPQKNSGTKNPQLPSSDHGSNLKPAAELKICTAEQRKHNLSLMHRRTQRLYEQLEEVKHLKTIRTRQEDYAKNRLKAKEFHKKTLQKLRAKQTR